MIELTGYLWVVKVSGEDCDIHLEISDRANIEAPRMIAEIPNTSDYCHERQTFMNNLNEIYSLNFETEHKFKKGDDIPKVTVTGYPFFDTPHWSKKKLHNIKGSSHGSKKVATLWEIHPVVRITIE